MTRRRLGLVASMLLLSLIPTLAKAHWVYEDGYFWESLTGKCLKAHKVEISHGSTGYGYTKVDAIAQKEQYDIPSGETIACFQGWERPSGTLGTHTIFFKWHSPSKQWAICRELAWKYNGSASAENNQRKSWTASDFCGDGYYSTVGHGYIRIDDQWRSDAIYGVYSGYHRLWDD